MGVEIERKFLLRNDDWRKVAPKGIRMAQWYLNEHGNTIRVRIADDKAYLTIKSKSVGISRMEFEYEIPLADAKELMNLTQTPIVDKFRYKIPYQGHVWEVDEFLGLNAGLVVAEVEMKCEDEEVAIPDWIGVDVSDDRRYRNTYLAKCPYSTWTD
ncbi:MAG: CYTH domain-containing protein [Paludibacteraceae bacterium]|nr:CYTH domain-containing protein [Paludibacteraceae bacterium]